MQVEKKIIEVLEEELGNLGFEFIKADSFPRGSRKILQIYIDHPDRNVTISDCVSVSKSLGLILDNLNEVSGPYNLEVSSPGVERPLVKPEHFARFEGKEAKIQFINDAGNKQSLNGKILESDDCSVVLVLKEDNVRIKFDKIITANLREKSENIGKGKPRRKKRGSK